MDEITHTILPNAGGNWGGTALGAGVGGLIGSWLGNGGFGGLGYRGAGAAVGYDTGALNGIQQTVNGIQQQIANADRDLLMQTSGQNQFLGSGQQYRRRYCGRSFRSRKGQSGRDLPKHLDADSESRRD